MSLPKTVTAPDLADLLGLTPRRIQQLAERGILTRSERGRYDLRKSVTGYVGHKASEIERRAPDSPLGDDIKREKARKLRLENDQTEAILVDTNDALAAVDAIFGIVQAELSAVPARLSDDVAERRRIEDAITQALTELADRFDKASSDLASGRDPLAPADPNDAG